MLTVEGIELWLLGEGDRRCGSFSVQEQKTEKLERGRGRPAELRGSAGSWCGGEHAGGAIYRRRRPARLESSPSKLAFKARFQCSPSKLATFSVCPVAGEELAGEVSGGAEGMAAAGEVKDRWDGTSRASDGVASGAHAVVCSRACAAPVLRAAEQRGGR
jgi:hypothetical protein